MSTDLGHIRTKVERGERLDETDAMALFLEPDLLALGALANTVRERLHGDRAYFNRNMRVELTNVCEAECRFCAFARLDEGAPGSRTLTVEQAVARVREHPDPKLTEVHMVNGHHPGLSFETYEAVLRGWREARPTVHRKCFTAAEIFFFAKRYEMSAGKARLAKDLVDQQQLNEKEGERKALEQVALAEFLASQGVAPPVGAEESKAKEIGPGQAEKPQAQ